LVSRGHFTASRRLIIPLCRRAVSSLFWSRHIVDKPSRLKSGHRGGGGGSVQSGRRRSAAWVTSCQLHSATFSSQLTKTTTLTPK